MGYICVLFKKDKIKLLADIIEIQSENENEIEVCHYIQNLLAQYDIPSKIIKVSETRANLVAEIGSGSPILAMSGHMDVVDAGHHENGLICHLNLQNRTANCTDVERRI